MKLFTIILFILLSYQAVFSQSSVMVEKLEVEFSKDTLTANDLKVYEIRAIQKLQEFSDYFEIISYSSYSEQLREKAIANVLSMFADERTTIEDSISTKPNTTNQKVKMQLKKFLSEIGETEYSSIKSEINSISVESKLSSPFDTYVGLLTYKQTTLFYKDNNTPVKSINTDKSIVIYVIKKDKQFGNKKKTIWEVKLGAIALH